jgi:hypothetical protein
VLVLQPDKEIILAAKLVKDQWPAAELFFNTDYVWSHTEFTPQQTMRGKTALYGYLYGISEMGSK